MNRETLVPSRSAANLLLLIAGLVVWSSAFVWLYAGLSVGCAFGWEERAVLGPLSLQRAMLVAIWLGHLALVAGLFLWTRRRARRAPPDDPLATFFARTALWASVVSIGVTLVNYAPILGLSTCL